MAMDGCGSVVKYVFAVANLVIFLGGCVLLGVGIAGLAGQTSEVSRLLGTQLYTGVAVIITIAGFLIVAISFLGCCGAFKESKCLLGTFFVMVLILFILVVAGAIAGFVLGGERLVNNIDNEMRESLQIYNEDEYVRRSWDVLQSHFQCCGVDSRRDWQVIVGPGRVPNSCCRTDRSGKTLACDAGRNSYDRGCVRFLREFVENHSGLFGGIAIGVAILLLASMICSCFIMKSIF